MPQSVDIFTDAALTIDQHLASAALYNPNVKEFALIPYVHPSSTNFEVQQSPKHFKLLLIPKG
jgi:hypothetical protein